MESSEFVQTYTTQWRSGVVACFSPYERGVSDELTLKATEGMGVGEDEMEWDEGDYQTALFACGTIEEEHNCLSVWGVRIPLGGEYDVWGQAEARRRVPEPCLLSTAGHTGDVTGLKFVDHLSEANHRITMACTSSTGRVAMYAVGGSGDMDDGNGTGSANAQLHAVSCTALEESDAIHTSPATDVCVHAESNQVLSTGEDGYIRGVHLLDGGRVLAPVNTHISLTSLDTTPSGNVLFTASVAGTLEGWKMSSSGVSPRPVLCLKDMNAGRATIHSVACHPHREHMVGTGDSEGNIKIWDSRNDACPILTQAAHISNAWEVSWGSTVQDDGMRLFSCSQDGNVFATLLEETRDKIGDVRLDPLLQYHMGINSIAISARYNFVVAAADNEALIMRVLS